MTREEILALAEIHGDMRAGWLFSATGLERFFRAAWLDGAQTMNNKDAETDADLLWRTMDDCPTGPKILLLNRAGIGTTGIWDGKDDWFVGWHPLPKIPPYIRELIEPTYRPQSRIGALIGD